ncbi:hypothetical protein BG000_006894, partial [Podila horticola]
MRGITVPYFVGRFVDPSLAFAVGWNYWYAYAMLIGAEATAAGIIIDYWKLPVNIAVWITIDGVLGFHYWKSVGAFVPYKAEGSTGRFLGYWHAFITAGFAFITSPELIAIAAGETIDPRRNIPKAARRFVLRLAVFYGMSSLIIGILVPSNDKNLLGASNASASP